MAKVKFREWSPTQRPVRATLLAAMSITEEYAALGCRITLRQLYYQLVSRNLLPNRQREYKRLSAIVTNGREGGWIDWDHIADRGCVLDEPPEWDSVSEMLQAAASGFRLNRWAGQERYVEIWSEKESLASVLQPLAHSYHVRFLSSRGYSSSSAMFEASRRFQRAEVRGQVPTVLYLGDHDPSGINMAFDIENRLEALTGGGDVEVVRIALNFDQVERNRLPANPVKLRDTRAVGYVSAFGPDCWELDALAPPVLNTLVADTIESMMDRDLYVEQVENEEHKKAVIRGIAEQAVGE